MRFTREFFHCGEPLKATFAGQIEQVEAVLEEVGWTPEHSAATSKATLHHQAAYNQSFREGFLARGWEAQPVLIEQPKLIGDFRKDLVFVEIQFGNSSALYRDYYKFQYGLAQGLLSLAVLIVPESPSAFFPTRPASVRNMAEARLARKCLTTLPIWVPTVVYGLLSGEIP